jgi:hypothetical protein
MTHVATCHCGATRLTVARLPETATTCTCTFCTKRGVLWGFFKPEEVVIQSDTEGRDYAPSGINHHRFCSKCGCSTWSDTPDWTEMDETGENPAQRIAVNLWLLDGVDARVLPVATLDGLNQW